LRVTLPAQSSPDATPPDEVPYIAPLSADDLPPGRLPEQAPPDRRLSSPAAFIGVVAVTTLVIILCVLGATMSGLFGFLGPSTEGEPALATSAPAPSARQPVTAFDDGLWAVGLDVRAGTYATVVPAGSAGCTWERKDSTDGSAFSVLESGVGAEGQRVVVDIKPTDKVFQSVGCGRWQLEE
jgi:hypothetical protein